MRFRFKELKEYKKEVIVIFIIGMVLSTILYSGINVIIKPITQPELWVEVRYTGYNIQTWEDYEGWDLDKVFIGTILKFDKVYGYHKDAWWTYNNDYLIFDNLVSDYFFTSLNSGTRCYIYFHEESRPANDYINYDYIVRILDRIEPCS